MSATDNIHPSALEVSAEVVEITGGGLRAVEIGAVMRRVRAHHRAHGSTLFVHRLLP